MYNSAYKILIAIAFIFSAQSSSEQILPSFGNSRAGTAGFQFLKIAPDARSAGLAGSFASMADDVSSVYWNPAGMTMTDTAHWHFQLGQTSYYSGIHLSYAGFIYSKSRLNFWGLHVLGINSGEMPVTTEFLPEGNGMTFSVSDLVIGLSYGKILSDNFSFGLTLKYVYENMAGITIQNGIFDFGFIYNVGLNRKTRFAVGVSNFGFNVSPSGKVVVSTLNGDKVYENFENVAVPAIFRLALSSRLVDIKQHHLTAAAQLSHPTDNNETISFGCEYNFKNLLFLRTGYIFGEDQKALPSFGFGVKLMRHFGGVSLDYGYNAKMILGEIHRITLSLTVI